MYVKLENNIAVRWPIGEYEVRAEYPEASLPEYLTREIVEPLGYGVFVVNGYPPEYDMAWQDIEEIPPVLKDDGKYHQSYKITEKYTPEEKQRLQDEEARQYNKNKAMQLLSESDWSDKPSVTDTSKPLYLVNAAEWGAYRDALRAIAVYPPVTVDVWPVKPEEVWSTT